MGLLKRFLMCLLFAGAFFHLAAQTTQTVSVFMQPFTGTGINEQDSGFYYMYIYRELEARNDITLGRASFSTDYTLMGAISPGGADRTFYFNLNVYDNTTGGRISEQRYRYSSLSNAEVAVKAMLDNIFALILPVQPVEPPPQSAQEPVLPAQIPARPVTQPVQPAQQPVQPAQQPDEPVQQPILPAQIIVQPPDEPAQPLAQPVKPQSEGDWRDKWVFVGFSAAWNPRLYIGETRQTNLGNAGLGFSLELQFLDNVSLGTGLGVTQELIMVERPSRPGEYENYPDLTLELPVLVRIVIKPGSNLMLEPYSGISLNFSLFGQTKPSQLSWVLGYQNGIKAGPGAFFFDFRFSMDLSKSSVQEREGITAPEYKRYNLAVGAGYKFGTIQK
jgi:hypothetical protein